MKLEFYRHIFEKYSNIKFHEHPSKLTDRRTDRRDEANSRFSQFCAWNEYYVRILWTVEEYRFWDISK